MLNLNVKFNEDRSVSGSSVVVWNGLGWVGMHCTAFWKHGVSGVVLLFNIPLVGLDLSFLTFFFSFLVVH